MKISPKLVIAGLIVIVAVVLVFLLSLELTVARKPWSVVYLGTGKVYVGKIVRFPQLQLHEAYQVESNPDPQDASKVILDLIPVAQAAWAPKKLYLNKDQIVFYGPLSEQSTILKSLREKGR